MTGWKNMLSTLFRLRKINVEALTNPINLLKA
jgi:hypothetical protein